MSLLQVWVGQGCCLFVFICELKLDQIISKVHVYLVYDSVMISAIYTRKATCEASEK